MYIVQRIFSALVILLLIAAAALWIIGGKKTENQTSLEFDATPEQIFPFLTEPSLVGQWFSGLVSIDPIESLPEDPNISPPPGIRRVLQNANGDRTNYVDQVLRYTPNRILALKSRSSGEAITWVYQLDPMAEDRTNVTLRVVKSASGISRLLAPLTEDISLNQIEVDIRQLKQVVENQSSTVSPIGVE